MLLASAVAVAAAATSPPVAAAAATSSTHRSQRPPTPCDTFKSNASCPWWRYAHAPCAWRHDACVCASGRTDPAKACAPPAPPLPPPGPPPKPSADQLAWLELEMGTFFHYEMYTFVSEPNNVSGPHEDCGQVFNKNLKVSARAAAPAARAAAALSDDERCSPQDMPAPSTFNPTQLDIDQWMLASKAFGAKYLLLLLLLLLPLLLLLLLLLLLPRLTPLRPLLCRYALLVAKHGSGWINFPTTYKFNGSSEPYGYGVQQASWRNGTGDLMRLFVDSARKHGLLPGVYYSLPGNFYLSIAGKGDANNTNSSNTGGGAWPVPQTTRGQHPVTQEEYLQLALHHLSELWGNYGPLVELWFDGGHPFVQLPAFQKKVSALAAKLQPHAVLLQGPSGKLNGARKGDGETATVHDPNWYTCPDTHDACTRYPPHDPLGGVGPFIPAEGEGCSVGTDNARQWFWYVCPVCPVHGLPSVCACAR